MNDTRATLIIADDEASLRKSLAYILDKAGYRILQADSGVEAIFTAQNNDAQLILMDLKMRNIDGLVATDAIFHLKPEMPVIILSAFTDEISTMRFPPNVKKVVAKPFEIDALLKIITETINNNG